MGYRIKTLKWTGLQSFKWSADCSATDWLSYLCWKLSPIAYQCGL